MGRIHYPLMYDSLVAAQSHRNDFPGIEWIDYERLTMLACVNMAREVEDRLSENKRPKLTLEDIEKVEQQARGHFDYTKKFALYCSELV